MTKAVSFHELADFELNDATVFLELEREGLGLRFLTAVEAAVTYIRDHPEASPVIIQTVRCKVWEVSLQHHVLHQNLIESAASL